MSSLSLCLMCVSFHLSLFVFLHHSLFFSHCFVSFLLSLSFSFYLLLHFVCLSLSLSLSHTPARSPSHSLRCLFIFLSVSFSLSLFLSFALFCQPVCLFLSVPSLCLLLYFVFVFLSTSSCLLSVPLFLSPHLSRYLTLSIVLFVPLTLFCLSLCLSQPHTHKQTNTSLLYLSNQVSVGHALEKHKHGGNSNGKEFIGKVVNKMNN